jgi:hypothetical protein
MLKKSASFILASALLGRRRVLARQGWAGEKSGHFEHPARCFSVVPDVRTSEALARQQNFSTAF